VEVQLRKVLASALLAGEWSTTRATALCRWKSSQYSLNRRLGGPKNWSARSGEEEKLLSLPPCQPRKFKPIA